MDKGLPVLAGGAGVALVAVSVVLPYAQSVPGPGVVDVVVPTVLFGCAVLLAVRRHHWPAALLALAGVLWCALGLVWALPEQMADGLARLGVMPLALVAMVVMMLPSGRPRQARGLSALALLVALAAGAGVQVPVRLSLGLLLLASALRAIPVGGGPAGVRTQSSVLSIALQNSLGVALVCLDPLVSGEFFRPDWAATSVGLLMAGAAVSATWILDPDRLVWKATQVSHSDRLGIESLVGDLLGSPGLRVSYPDGRGGHLLEDGSRSAPPMGPQVVSEDGEEIACFGRAVVVDPAIRPRLVRLLETVGASARLRAAQRARSAELQQSRARLAEAAFDERVALERRLAHTVLPLLEDIEARCALLPDPSAVQARVSAARTQVQAAARGLAPVGSRSLAEALTDLASLAPDVVSVDVLAIDAAPDGPKPDDSEATALWFSAAESVSNALKHAGGPVVVRALGPCDLEVTDNGPGGADPAGSGLAGIRDRVEAVGGQFELYSDSSGTRVRVSVPGRVRAGTYPERGLVAMPTGTSRSYRR